MADTVVGPVSILFNAASLLSGAFSPPFQASIQGVDTFTNAASLIDIVTLDVTLDEVHSYSAEVTEHPVEQGADITDHVRPKPVELRMRGIVSNAPLDNNIASAAQNANAALNLVGLNVQALAAQALLTADASKLTFQTLTRLSRSGSPCIVHTPFRDYGDMIMQALEITRDQKTGDAIGFSCGFRQITTVESATATVILPPQAQAALNTGAQGTGGAGAATTANAKDILLKTPGVSSLEQAPAWFSKMVAKEF